MVSPDGSFHFNRTIPCLNHSRFSFDTQCAVGAASAYPAPLFVIEACCACRLRLCFDCATTKVLMAKESALKRLRIRKADDSYLSVGVFFFAPALKLQGSRK